MKLTQTVILLMILSWAFPYILSAQGQAEAKQAPVLQSDSEFVADEPEEPKGPPRSKYLDPTYPKQDAPKSTDATSAKLINLYLKAIGGVQNIKKIHSMRLAGVAREGKETRNVREYFKAPSYYRIGKHHYLLGRDYISITVTDGKTGWTQELSPKEKNAEDMPAGSVNAFVGKMPSMHDDLVDWERKGYTFSYEGDVRLSSKKRAYLVKGKVKYGEVKWYYFDQKTFQLLKIGFKKKFGSTWANADLEFRKFKRVNGVLIPVKIEYTANGKAYRSIEYTEVDVNIDIPHSMFIKPAFKGEVIRIKRKGR